VAVLNLKMSIAAATTTVAVTTEAPLLDVSDSRVQTTINTEQLQDLPVRKNFFKPGRGGPGITDTARSEVELRGRARQFGTEKTVDATGTAATRAGTNSLGRLEHHQQHLQGTANLTPNADSIRELTVHTNLFNVEHGRGTRFNRNDHEVRNQRLPRTGAYFSRTDYGRGPLSNHCLRALQEKRCGRTFGADHQKSHFRLRFRGTAAWANLAGGNAAPQWKARNFVSFAQSLTPIASAPAFSPNYPLFDTKFVSVLEDAQQAFGAGAERHLRKYTCNTPVIEAFLSSPVRFAMRSNTTLASTIFLQGSSLLQHVSD